MKKAFVNFIFILILLLASAWPALAQPEEELALRISRIVGYSSGSGRIQGAFKLKATGPDSLTRVVFSIDGKAIGEATEAPFELRFSTDDYELGVHTMTAVGTTSDGTELLSNEIRAEFVPASEGWQTAGKIMIPFLVIIFGAMLLSVIVPLLPGRKPKPVPLGAERKYGISGGAICPRCKRPFALRFLAINLGPTLKFDRCPHCGRWAAMRSRSLADLRAAEAAELAEAQASGPAPALTEVEKLRSELEGSRFLDH
jgi:hypothetical protein